MSKNGGSERSSYISTSIDRSRSKASFFKIQDLTADDLRGSVFHARQKPGTPERRTWHALGIARSTLRHQIKDRNDDDLRLALIRLAKRYGR